MIQNYTSKTIYQIAQALGRKKTSVGYHLQTVLKLKIPAEVYLQNKQLRKAKAEQRKITNAANAQQQCKQKAVKKLLQKQNPLRKKHTINPVKKIYKDAVIKIADHSNLIPLRINHKTTLYLKPGADIAAIKKQYCFI